MIYSILTELELVPSDIILTAAPVASTCVVVPTYNEAENIVELTNQILALPIDAQVIIVDDNSPDGTGRLAAELQMQDNQVHVIHRPARLGLGTAPLAKSQSSLPIANSGSLK